MRRKAKDKTIRGCDREERRHDIARAAWSDEPVPVVLRLQAGVADLQSRLEAERLNLRPQPGLNSRLRERIKAARDLLQLLGAGRPAP
jgi:hypothetical protein